MGSKFAKKLTNPITAVFFKILEHPLSSYRALKEKGAMSRAWQREFNAFAYQNTLDKLILFSAALWVIQAATVIWYFILFGNGTIGMFGLIGRLLLSVIYVAGISAMNNFAVNGGGKEKARDKAEDRVLVYLILMTLGQIFYAALDKNSAVSVYRLIVTAVIAAMLPDSRTEKFTATTGALYTAICAAIILIPAAEGNAAPVAHLPAVVFAVAGAEFVCLFVRSHVVTTFIHQKTSEEAAERLEAANKKLLASNEALEKLSTTDQLTQIPNRRAFDAYIQRVWHECRRLRKPLSVLMMDIDHFKAFNDYYGHVEGDDCLKTVADCGKKHYNRAVDLFARYGGEEFVAVLPFTGSEAAIRLAEATRADVEVLKIPNPHSSSSPYVTISIGAATFLPEGDNYESIVEAADKSLYEAKETGRNKVISDCGSACDLSVHAHIAEVHEEFERFRSALVAHGAALFTIDLTNSTIAFSREFAGLSGLSETFFEPITDFYRYFDTTDAATFADMVKRLRLNNNIGEPRFKFISPEGRVEINVRAARLSATGFVGEWAVGVIWRGER